MLLLMRANIPNVELFAAKTDRELALLAVKFGVSLPQYLSHLPNLPPPITEEQKEEREKLAVETAAMETGKAEAIKERPPRRARLGLSHTHDLATPKSTPPDSPTAQMQAVSISSDKDDGFVPRPPAITASASQAAIRGKIAEAMEATMLGKGKAQKERPERQTKKRGGKNKAEDGTTAT